MAKPRPPLLIRLLRLPWNTAKGLAVNIAYFISGFFKRDKNLWLFGAWEGNLYRDNSRYLFESLIANPGFRPSRFFWVTNSRAVERRLKDNGYPVLFANDWKTWWLHLRAGVIFVTHGRHDVVKFLTRGATMIYLNHALPIKHMGYDIKRDPYCYPPSIWRKLFFMIFDPYWNLELDYAISASTQTKELVGSRLRMHEDRIWSVGFPRFRPLETAARESQVRRDNRPRQILYMPTFRDTASFSHFNYGFDLKSIEKALESMNAVMLLALHPFDRAPVPEELIENRSGRLRLFQPADVNELLPDIDVLVTDFSSVMFDYLILDRPIVFTQFDFEDFLSNQRGVYFEYAAVTPGTKVRNWPELIETLRSILVEGKDSSAALRREVRARILHPNYEDVNEQIIKNVRKLTE